MRGARADGTSHPGDQRVLISERHGHQAGLPRQDRQGHQRVQSRLPQALHQTKAFTTSPQARTFEETGNKPLSFNSTIATFN